MGEGANPVVVRDHDDPPRDRARLVLAAPYLVLAPARVVLSLWTGRIVVFIRYSDWEGSGGCLDDVEGRAMKGEEELFFEDYFRTFFNGLSYALWHTPSTNIYTPNNSSRL